MIRTIRIALALLTCSALTAHAQVAAPAAPPAAPPSAMSASPASPPKAPHLAVAQQQRINLAWQIALEAADFSPGIIDGAFGAKGKMALKEYAARYFPGLSPYDAKVYDALKVDVDGAVTAYTITDDDAAQIGTLPDDWNDKARLHILPYDSMADCIAEKFHCTEGLLGTLNPGVKLNALQPGMTLTVPAIRPFPNDNRVAVAKRAANTASITVDLGEKTIRLFDISGGQIALFHCSIARDKAKLPARDTKVQVIAAPNPTYTFDPKNWPEVTDVHNVLIIPPGPRNPVGLAWVGLDLPGYGIHGSPKPELIGKTGSHGCFRLTNWDALKFAGLVREGMPVKIINPEKDAAGQ